MSLSRAILLAILSLTTALHADQASLDKLVKTEQANVDNEAVSVYGGKVGKLEAVFFIEWAGVGNPVEGHYYYPSRGKETRYKLKGSNPKDGVLLLEELTKKDGIWKLSATCRLAKRAAEGRVVWEGTMNNTDGRELEMSFSRPK
jgi:hypothetical protein